MADRQDYPGRCIAVCKRHCGGISELSGEEWLSLKEILNGVETMLKNVLGASCVNCSCLMNDAYKSERPNPHIHFHLRPMYSKPVNIGSIHFVDKKFGHHYDNKALVPENTAAQEIFELLSGKAGAYFI